MRGTFQVSGGDVGEKIKINLPFFFIFISSQTDAIKNANDKLDDPISQWRVYFYFFLVGFLTQRHQLPKREILFKIIG